jgi:dihydropyrimidinase
VFAETCPQYLFLTAEDLGIDDSYQGARCVCSPPPRDKANQQVIWDGLGDGLFTVFSSDHAPFATTTRGQEARRRGSALPPHPERHPGLETRLPLLYSEGVLGGRITLQKFVELTATNPAKAYGLHPRKGTIAVGSDADLVVWDEREFTDPQRAAAPRRRLHALRRHASSRPGRADAGARRSGVGRQALHRQAGRGKFLPCGTPSLLPSRRTS